MAGDVLDNDLEVRLRDIARARVRNAGPLGPHDVNSLSEWIAAAEIESLRAENERIRQVRTDAKDNAWWPDSAYCELEDTCERLRAQLANKKAECKAHIGTVERMHIELAAVEERVRDEVEKVCVEDCEYCRKLATQPTRTEGLDWVAWTHIYKGETVACEQLLLQERRYQRQHAAKKGG